MEEIMQSKILPKEFIKDIIHYCGTNGLLLRSSNHPTELRTIAAPINIFPTPYSKSLYTKASTAQPSINLLIENISRNHEFIHSTLQPFRDQDIFLHNLLNISKKNHNMEKKQEIYLGLLRTDYMSDISSPNELKIIEYNTIASSFGNLTDKLHDLHTYIAQRYPEITNIDPNLLPPRNNFIERAGDVISKCHEMYIETAGVGPEEGRPYMAIICTESEQNIYDQKGTEYYLWDKYRIPTMRLTMKEVYQNHQVDQNNRLKVYIYIYIYILS